MQVKVLGCSGGIGGDRHTTCLLVDHDVIIDAGTGLTTLSLEELQAIDHVFLTHSHLDHVAALPFLVDSVGYLRGRPVVVHSSESTWRTLTDHVFNWEVWPDFSRIPAGKTPYMVFEPISMGQTISLGPLRRVTSLPVNHVVPAMGYHLAGAAGSLVFSGDTTSSPPFWQAVNRIEDLRYVLLETAFSEERKDVAVASKHLCPSLLAQELLLLKRSAEIYVTHLKPGEEAQILDEIKAAKLSADPRPLRQGQVFTL